ncbi:uncharacterized protein LOC126763623 isoform X1 [Bactrocera neohumeralis]|uniref:uncharacterized protein LOC126763623 isoform X1 n=2 Tax=Bactrocera neohumeralis TaxID=98809 RepID=UPI002165B36B|nr:uncharacterized protein LOC126763623 isoform X1 [Bactrocera neohumeralis]
MAPVKNVTTVQVTKETEMQKSKQTLMQQQLHKRSHRSAQRHRINSGVSGGSGTTGTSSDGCVQWQVNSNDDYAVSTNRPTNRGATVKTHRASATTSGETETAFPKANNRNFKKSNINNNNNTSSGTADVQRKRQHSPEKSSTRINGNITGSHCDISKSEQNTKPPSVLPCSSLEPKSAERVLREASNSHGTNSAQIQKILKEPHAISKARQSSLVKLTKVNKTPLLPVRLLNLGTSITTTQTPTISALSTAVARAASATNPQQIPFGEGVNVESILLQRLQLIKHFLNVTAPTITSLNQRLPKQNEDITPRVSVANLTVQQNSPKPLMVYENKSESMEREVVVNSASLEDVALSELSDNRAQSIQSLHSVETPTPDDSPSFDELQQRLETSNRNIQNMQEQQQQLLRLQNAAKQHLSEMEHLRQQAGTLSFGSNQLNGSSNADGTPEYESIDQVHSDMATLVGRMKNLTTFIQNQNELSNLLGDDGPEILAEQEALQRKLESLRAQRDDMRTLVSELQDINRNAERRCAMGTKESEDEATVSEKPVVNKNTQEHEETPNATNGARIVPVTYTRTVPIKLTNGGVTEPAGNAAINANDDDDEDGDPEENAATAMLIQQKVADIETMRKQLQRLKDMMETVNIIEARTSRDVNDIGRTPPRELRSQSRSTGSSFDRDCTPVSVVPAHAAGSADDVGEDVYLTRKMRMINEVTADLRAQAESLQAERDRIKALKEEIVLRKQQAADAAKLGEDALKRSSLTPTPTPRSRKQREIDTPTPPPSATAESDQLKKEYEAKKKEFELLCQRLQQDENSATIAPIGIKAPRRSDTVSEADDEADCDEELNDSDIPTSNTTSTGRQYFSAPQQQSTPAQQHRAAAKAAVTAHTLAAGAASAKINEHCLQTQGQRISAGALGKEDSFDTNLTSSTAAERRHSTLANANSTTQEGASLEAGSVQSGSSQFSMPPPMPPMGACSSWPPLPPMPNTWNPQLYYGFGAPPHPLTASQPNSAATNQSVGAPFTPVGLLPQSAVNSECICSAANSATNAPIISGPTPATSSTNTAAQLAADPVLLQQFVQTQQMLINSVCQCNQMLWHQQREIDALNNTIHVLQERLLTLTGNVNAVPLTDLPYSLRAESVPPPGITAGTLPNNLYLSSSNRAQSEQPALFMPGLTTTTRNSAFSNYQRHQQQQQYQQHGRIATAFSSETQHSNIAAASSTNAGLYNTLNNAAPPPPPNHGASHYNNEAPQSPPLQGNAAGPGPIFMHHHNNAIHQNNANLRTQNHYANNLHQQQQLQQQQQHGHSNINIGGGNTLNNQVPPGNRANNYWDNFRSYSRQNLLSTNSNKSNEEQQQHNQQQQQQHQHQLYLQQRTIDETEARGAAQYRSQSQGLRRSVTTTLPAALTSSNLQQLQRQQQQREEAVQQRQQQQQRATQTQPQLYRTVDGSNSNSCNNLNYERNANDNKYLRTLQRSHINRYQQQQQQQQQNVGPINSLYTNHNNLYQSSWLPPAGAAANATNCADVNTDADNVDIDVYDAYNIIDSDLAAPYAHLSSNMGSNSSNMLRNMNVNFGNSPHYQRNKLLTKPNCRGAEAMDHHNPNRMQAEQQQQQQQQHQHILSQQQLVLRAQQQIDQSTAPTLRNMVDFTQARHLDLLPASVSEAVAAAEAQLRNRERVDLLLRTVTADDNDTINVLPTTVCVNSTTTYNSPYMPNANALQLMDTNGLINNTPNINNENAAHEVETEGETAADLNVDIDLLNDEEEDDTTSEEIKRNLLVNALKNDKFTTKFYESIKEDVFRRLERMLLEKESVETNCVRNGGQICDGSAGPNAGNSAHDQEESNDLIGASDLTRDPTRKFNLNARMGNQQQQQRLQQYKQQQEQLQNPLPMSANFSTGRTPNSTNSYAIKQESNDDLAAEDDQHALPAAPVNANVNNRQAAALQENAEEDEYGANNADTESNKADNEDAAAALVESMANVANTDHMSSVPPARESEQPEEDDMRYNNSNITSNNVTVSDASAPSQTHQHKLSGSNVRRDGNTVPNWRQNVFNHAESNTSNKSTTANSNKPKNRTDAVNNSGAGGDAEAMPSSIVGSNTRPTYGTDLITYIITRIHNQTHVNTQINDTVLVEIAKLTACAVQKFAPMLVNHKTLPTASPHISPKKFYMRIKKLCAPRQRDEFLQWYRNYLEGIFPGARSEGEWRQGDDLSMSGTSEASSASLELPRNRNKMANQQQTQQQQGTSNSNKENNDEDLAEADQNSANSSNNTSNTLFDNTFATNTLMHENELENKENPDDNVVKPEKDSAKTTNNNQSGEVAGAYCLMPLSAAASAAAAVTEEAINAAIQQRDTQHFATNGAEGGTAETHFTPHNTYT